MGVNFPLLTGSIAIYFACLVRCGTPGFIFPANETSSNATFSDIEIHFNDSMVVEYTPGAGEIVLLGQSCYNYSASPPDGYSENPQTFYLSSSCKFLEPAPFYPNLKHRIEDQEAKKKNIVNNTGTLLWNIGNGNNGDYTGINFCQLALMDITIYECAWGPFGLTSFNQTRESVY
jgi:hypothetical protein